MLVSYTVIRTHVSVLFQILFPVRLLQSWAESPVLSSSSLLDFKYSDMCVSVPKSWPTPPCTALPPVTPSSFLRLWVCFCVVNKIISIIFSDSACKWCNISVFLCLIFVCNLQVHPCSCKWHYFFFYGWVVFHCIYVPMYVPHLFYLFIYRWTFR